MVRKDIVDWIKSKEQLGYSEQQLQNYLLQLGYNSNDIKEAISSINPHHSSKRLYLVILFIVVILGIVSYFGIYLLQKQDTTNSLSAWNENDVSYCDKISFLNKESYESCYFHFAVKNLNSELCNPLKINRNNCFTQIAINTSDFRLCENLESPGKSSCLYQVSQVIEDPKKCEEVSSAQGSYETCLSSSAVKKGNPETCSKIKNSNKLSSCYYKVAVILNDSLICERIISSSVDYPDCFIEVAKNTNNITLCTKLPQDSREFKRCIESVTRNSKNVADCDFISDSLEKDKCVNNIARSNNNYLMCNGIREDALKSTCISKLKETLRDPIICEGIDELSERDGCAKKACSNFKELKYQEDCVKSLAIKTKDPYLCFSPIQEIQDKEGTKECLSRLKAESIQFLRCTDLEVAWQDSCFNTWGSVRGSLSTCNLVKDDKMKKECTLNIAITRKDSSLIQGFPTNLQDEYYSSVAYKQLDASLCNNLIDENRIKSPANSVTFQCFKQIAVSRSDVTVCDSAPVEIISHCKSIYAWEKADSSLCASVSDLRIKDDCYNRFGSIKGDMATCNKISDSLIKANCINEAKIAIGDVTECEKLGSEFQKDSCLLNAAKKSKDVKICDSIKNTHDKTVCYTGLAEINADLSLCNKDIIIGPTKSNCYIDVAKATKNLDLCNDPVIPEEDRPFCVKKVNG